MQKLHYYYIITSITVCVIHKLIFSYENHSHPKSAFVSKDIL